MKCHNITYTENVAMATQQNSAVVVSSQISFGFPVNTKFHQVLSAVSKVR